MQFSITICSRLEAAVGVISGKFMRQSIAKKAVKLGDPQLNSHREIRPKAESRRRHFYDVSFGDNCRTELASEDMSYQSSSAADYRPIYTMVWMSV